MSWVVERFGVELRPADRAEPLDALVGLALRRNPRRAHLLVSGVLGKHVPADPRVFKPADTFDPSDPQFKRRRGEKPDVPLDDPKYIESLRQR